MPLLFENIDEELDPTLDPLDPTREPALDDGIAKASARVILL